MFKEFIVVFVKCLYDDKGLRRGKAFSFRWGGYLGGGGGFRGKISVYKG